jgi:hypothetical protein
MKKIFLLGLVLKGCASTPEKPTKEVLNYPLARSLQQQYGVKDQDMTADKLYKHVMAHDF